MNDIAMDFEQSYHVANADIADEAIERIKQILDAKYEPADLLAVSKEADHLSVEKQTELHQSLIKYESLFDGTLGHWDDVRRDSISRKSLPHTPQICGHPQTRGGTSMQSRRPQKGKQIRMGCTNLHHSQEGRISKIHLRLSGTE
jgi:hypothetical protein